MDTTVALGALVLIAIALAGIALFRRPDRGIERALRTERDQLSARNADLLDALREASADAARHGERAAAASRGEQALAAASAELSQLQRTLAERDAHSSRDALALSELRELVGRLEGERDAARAQVDALRGEVSDLSAKVGHGERSQAELKAFIASARERLSVEFAELAGRTFDERSRQSVERSREELSLLLKPFAERLDGFSRQVATSYGDEARERAQLTGKIDELKTLNQDMAQRASELATALRGNAKVRGDWGELMLEHVLQSSGLTEGTHYVRQKGVADDEGQRRLPDVVVQLPDERAVVVDSKVNLIAWQDAMNAVEPDAQQEALKRHAVALRQHVRDLGTKNYPSLVGDGALEITIAFVPIEGALSAALGADASLQTYAFDQRVAFASPNTLMALLRVIERLWTRDKIQREAVEIARSGGLVLDALQNFLDDFDNVGKQLDQAQKAYALASGKLRDSSTAAIPRATRLVQLGARGRKRLGPELMAGLDDAVVPAVLAAATAPDALPRPDRDG